MAASKENKQAEVSDHTQGPEWGSSSHFPFPFLLVNQLTPPSDASKTPPSRFQQRKGSIYATPGSRDGHVDKNADRDVGFHEKVKEMVGKGKKDRRASKGSDS